ncbi:MAG: HupE/UreJ family protein [Saprospiraceae bacterium]|nr:HupE/UreJ family protein [Saprospiraceae bacterium]MBK9729210.1 HupE/UreJ family protein [Saprospiraceae bacterium]
MDDFQLWFRTGAEHILDLNGYDHILFILVLSILFSYRDWKPLLFLVTAFTIGHSLTLAMSVFDWIQLQRSFVEVCIALTIVISSIFNLLDLKRNQTDISGRYLTVVLFGCVHGLGFSYLLKSMLGHQESILLPLFYFNLGLEAGQIIIVLFVLILKFILISFWKSKEKIITTTITFVILLWALQMLLKRILNYE